MNDFEKFFLSCLGSGENLKWELDNNVNLLDVIDPKILFAADIILALISRSKKEEIVNGIDADRIIGILKRERNDLYSILVQHPRGREWIGIQIKNFKKRFLK